MRLAGDGIWSWQLRRHEDEDEGELREAAAELEALGYSVLWVPGRRGGPAFDAARRLLRATCGAAPPRCVRRRQARPRGGRRAGRTPASPPPGPTLSRGPAPASGRGPPTGRPRPASSRRRGWSRARTKRPLGWTGVEEARRRRRG